MKTVDEIYQEMLSCYGERTGMEPEEGCDLAVRLYALAAQIYTLWVETEWVGRQAFPQTAEGQYLDYHAQMRGLARKQAQPASGTVRFVLSDAAGEERTIPKGTVCMTAGLIRFETTEKGVIPAGSLSAEIPIRAVQPGAMGNVAAGAITVMSVAPVGVARCTNGKPCAGGSDEEGDEALRARVLETFRRMPNGANSAFYQQEALSFEEVAAATVIPRPRGTGTVDVVVAAGEGLPNQDLLEKLAAHLEERREIAVDVQVRAPETAAVSLQVAVAPREGATQEQAIAEVEAALRGWFTGKRLGQNVLLAELANLIYSCEAVANYVIRLPERDVAVAADVLPVLDSLILEEMA